MLVYYLFHCTVFDDIMFSESKYVPLRGGKINMEEKHCQSCGMPMGVTNEMYGTNADKNKRV